VGLLVAGGGAVAVDRLVLIDAVPLLDGFTWPRLLKLIRLPAIGELAMGFLTRSMLARLLGERWTDERITAVWEQFDQGTQRAILRLHRAASEQRLAELGTLGELEVPALIIWGREDRWLDPALAERYAARLGDARVERIDGAGHWPWLEHPEVVEMVARFLAK
jgi:pimeloyl-ACP methyl ester carboxylesterase